jgi:hypothetical protein
MSCKEKRDHGRADFSLWFILATCVVDLRDMLDLGSKASQQLLTNYFANSAARFQLRALAWRRIVQSSIANRSFR